MSSAERTGEWSSPGTDPTYIPSGELTYYVETGGGLLTDQTVLSLRQDRFEHPAVAPESFSLPGEAPRSRGELEERIALAWEDLVERWDEVSQDLRILEMDISEVRKKWVLKLFEALGFNPDYQRSNVEAGGMEFNLSHTGWPEGELGGVEPPVLHSVEPSQGLEEKPKEGGRGASSPHDALQRFLNASPEHQWGIVTNGIELRVLRDYYHTYTRGYVEFDLENIFTTRNYADFRALYRLCHASRFLPLSEGEETPLEAVYQTSRATGVKVGQDLQSNVVRAIETLGNGLLNPEIRRRLSEGGEEAAQAYYQELLTVIYRLLFLLFAEQRGLMPGRDSLYTEEYSVTRLRERAERRRGRRDKNLDLWHGLLATFRLVEKGDEDLNVPGYNGLLFDNERLRLVTGSECRNDALLEAVANLTLIEREGVLQRISYADVGVEEVGSIYESLLEFAPRLAEEHVELEDRSVPAGEFFLDDRGVARKETGSYYTNPGLVRELVKSALEPVVEDRLEEAGESEESRERALLDIKVCDPACGSAAFLIAATHFLGSRLAEIRTGTEYPPEKEVRRARRKVLQNCIYGVDLNPMAVELAKVSLWIDTAIKDLPLNFLDHRIRHGNSLVGTTHGLVEKGLPEDAYETSKGREGHPGNELRKQVRQQNKKLAKSGPNHSLDSFGAELDTYASIAQQMNEIRERTSGDIERKEALFHELRESEDFQREKQALDAWTAAFFWPMGGSAKTYPLPNNIQKLRRKTELSGDLAEIVEKAEDLAEKHRFFHWELEFPDIFSGDDPGFDVVLGNPPWEELQAEEKKWFSAKDEKIASASGSKRKNLIKKLKKENPELHAEWERYKKGIEHTSRFIKHSGRFRLSAQGKLNFYPIFTELDRNLINDAGRAGIVVQSGIATDFYNKDLFHDFMKKSQLASLHDFENSEGLFPGIHRSYKFSLLTLTGQDRPAEETDFAFYLTNLDHLQEEERHFPLTDDEIELLNPNTKTCPTFRSKKDAELTKKIYRQHPVLINEHDDREDDNPWGISFRQGLFNMTSDSHLFKTQDVLEQAGLQLDGNTFHHPDTGETWLPLYEGKMIWHFDHRFAEFSPGAKGYGTVEATLKQHQDSEWEPMPRYWVDEREVKVPLFPREYSYLLGIRRFGGATNERNSISSILPFSGTGDNLTLIFSDYFSDMKVTLLFVSMINSLVFDFLLRNKLGGMMINQYHLEQIACLKPMKLEDNPNLNILKKISFQLLYTSHSLEPFARDLGYDGEPFEWDPEERRHLRAELDAIVAHLYGVTKDDLAYILDTFPIVKRNDEKEFGEYRTKRLVLEYFEEYQSSFGGEW